ncbi:uncharacterized protein LOC110458016 isoform X4 [Mizuhopecten yessoensis]|uniref:uncharacterized protein LOC110458016 isoform X4 n=1 Tax=Mizuhopecten yessoensis TaxID=6573 RepID=UPI000B45B239|nr:uncharacterized protein LOC110458016 isoform X4 [Mizuhopecten yessoensis]
MSHVHEGPLATYNSLTDRNLAGYFSNIRMRRHLRKSGLISGRGRIVSENQYRLNMARKEHKRHVKDLLSQAIVHKTLDLERTRQVEIKRKLEEIGKIELVRRVRAANKKSESADLLPLLTPKMRKRPTPSVVEEVVNEFQNALTCPPKHVVIYVDENGRPLTPTSEMGEESHSPSRSKGRQEEIDTRHLYALDSNSLKKYALTLSKIEQGEGLMSPYGMNQIPTPPRSARSGKGNNSARARGSRPRTADARMSSQRDTPEKRSPTMRNTDEESRPSSQLSVVEGALMLHRQEPAVMHQGEVQTLCEITMKYHGPNLTLPRDQYEPKQEVAIDQQHCGGNTLTVFKERLKAGDKFTFISRRHRGFPFSLSVYVDGRMDFRISRCCEYKHFKGVRLGGKLGHFSLLGVEGATPCYRCALNTQATPRSLKRPVPVKQKNNKAEEIREEIIVPKPIQKRKDEKTEESEGYDDDFEEDEDDKKKTNGKYEEDRFESSSSSSSSEDEAPPAKTKSTTITGYEDEVEDEPPVRKSKSKTGLDHTRKIEAFSSDNEDEDENTSATETFVITTSTADKPSAGTDANVFIVLIGTNNKSTGKIWLKKGKFHRGRSDIFTEKVPDIESPVKDIEIGHDCSGGPKQTWNLQEVHVYCPRTGIKQTFPVYKLLTPENPSVTVSEQRSVRKNVKEDDYPMRRSSTSSSSSSSSSSSESGRKAKKEVALSVSVDTRTEMTESTERPPSSASSHSIDVDSPRPETPSRRSPSPRRRSPSPPSPRRRSPSPPSPRRRSRSPSSSRSRSPSPRRRSPSPPSTRPKSPERSPTPPRREESPSPVLSTVVKDEPVKAQLIIERSSSTTSFSSETETESEMPQKEDRKFIGKKEKEVEPIPVPAVFSYETPFQHSESKQLEVRQGIQETPRSATSGSSSDSSSDSSDSETETETTRSQPPPVVAAKVKTEAPVVVQATPAVERAPKVEPKSSESETETQTETETETESGKPGGKPSIVPILSLSPKPAVKDTPRSTTSDSSSDSDTETQTETDTDTKRSVPQPPKPPSPIVATPVSQEKRKSDSSSSSSSGSGSETETQTETDTEKQGRKQPSPPPQPRKSPPPVAEVKTEKVKSSTESSSSSSGSDTETQTETDTDRKARVPSPPPAPVTVTAEKKEAPKKSSDSDSDSGSDGDSDSSSDSESELTEDDKKKLKQEPVKQDLPPKASFPLTDSDAPHVVSESDGNKFNVFGSGTDTDNMHGGNDPDSVTAAGPIKSAYLLKIGVKPGQPLEGSILPKVAGETDIELSAIALTTEQVKELGTYIEKSKNIKSVCLRNCGIDDDKFDKIVDSIESTESDIKMLNLNLNKLGDSAAADIADMLGEKSSVEILLIHGNPLGDKGVKNLVMGILDIGDSDDDDKGEVNLRELDLGDTNMGDSGMSRVAIFLEKNTTLKTLNLNGNKAVTVEGWQRLGKALKKNKTLHTLSLDFNNIGDEGIAAVVEGLRTNVTLQTLELEDVGITKKGGKMLRDLVKDNPTILEVTIFPGNDIPDDIRDDIKTFLGLSNEAHKKRQQMAS